MGSGKRASMREGPLAALFRKTETEGIGEHHPRQESQPPTPSNPRPIPTPEERLRHAFSTDVPNDMLAPEESAVRDVPPPSAADYQWNSAREEPIGQPQIVV